ncbi:methyltransferase domain-containing protein [Sphaerisporangium aureirubrum]|uniref:Protein-L-isoaspartate O-methyltransferase n=1 Tax=Sphaerisporangium aureirubrum TaxID=1544736 RepID=A0ABW1NHE4_9ACTN
MSADQRITALADQLVGLADRWRDAWHAVPRHLFIPDRAWCDADHGPGRLIDREADPEAWLDAVYSDAAIVTQLDDGTTDIAEGKGDFTSSSSAPGVVAKALGLLDPYDGDEILEIGTGTGWTAGLLAHRLGDENVTSVEIDAAVSAAAATNLKSAGHSPRLVVGDGAVGWADGAPYDRVHVTCGVRDMPHSWVRQTRPGGVIVVPWTPRWQGGHLTVLIAVGDGTATGRFHGGVDFMLLRSQRRDLPRLEGDYRRSSTYLDPRRVVRSPSGAHIAVAGLVPDVYGAHADQAGGEFHLSLWSEESDAQVHYAPDYKRVAVLQRGSRDLWDEMAGAYLRWVSWGAPGRERLGLTVTPEGDYVWLDSPEHPIMKK